MLKNFIKKNYFQKIQNYSTTKNEINVKNEYENSRIDNFLKNNFSTFPISFIQKLIRKNTIKINGKKCKDFNTRVHIDDIIQFPNSLLNNTNTSSTFTKKEKKSFNITPEIEKIVKSWVIFKNHEIIIINKPAGIAVQGGSNQTIHIDGMLDSLKYDYNETPKLVHRIDKNTSGILVLARNKEGANRMQQWFREKELCLKKCYWALVENKPKPITGRVKMSLKKIPSEGGSKMIVVGKDDKEGKMAISEYIVLESLTSKVSLCAVFPITGRMHQIRVHMSIGLNCQVLGDKKYGIGIPLSLKQVMENKEEHNLYLHSKSILLPYLNEKNERIIVSASLPKYFSNAMKQFEFNERCEEKMMTFIRTSFK
jgi:23S rRNA pseudouridine955/2504/2580 synthase